MKRKVIRGFLDAYRGDVDGKYLIAPDAASGKPGMYAATDRDGNPVLVKLWPLTGKKERPVLQEIWRHELRQLHRLAGYPGAEEFISILVDAGSDQHGFYLVLASGQRQPLAVTLDTASSGHWLKTPRRSANRIRIWRNLSRLAKGLARLIQRHGRDSVAGVAQAADYVYGLGVETIPFHDHAEPHPPCPTIRSHRSCFQP